MFVTKAGTAFHTGWCAIVIAISDEDPTRLITKASEAIIQSVFERRRWRNEYDRAKTAVMSNAPPVEGNSATRLSTEGGRGHE